MLRLGPGDLCLNVMPMFHIHGIVACLLTPLVSGGKVIVSEGIDAPRFFRLLSANKATWYSAVPTRQKNLLDHLHIYPGLQEGHRLRLIRSSSSALPVTLYESLEKAFGVPVIEAYGMTEATHQKLVRSLFHLRPRSRGQVLAMAMEYGLFDPVDYSLPTL